MASRKQRTTEPVPPLRKRKPRGCAGIFFVFMLIVAAAWGLGLGVFASKLEEAKVQIAALDDFRPKVGSKVYSSDGAQLGEFTTQVKQLVPLNEIPLHLQKAFIASEDHKFYEHKGVRPAAIASAALYILRTGNIRGGSTITQQLVRNIDPLPVGMEQTVQRKLREAQIALQLEREFTKDEILELYLNQIFLGLSASGVEGAARQYFGVSCRDLTLGQCAMLAGLAPEPNNRQPIDYPERAQRYRDAVLDDMLRLGYITREEYEGAKAESVVDQVISREERAALEAEGRGVWKPNRFAAPYFVEDVRKYIMNSITQFKTEDWFENGLEIHTTLDMRLQKAAEDVLLTALDDFDEEKRAYLQRVGREDEFEPVTGALVCIDNRPGYEGYVRALIGGRNFETSKFNTATQAKRQPGSSIKPFVWAAAIASGMTPSDIVVDEPYTWYDAIGRPWRPGNFESGRFSGPVTLRTALQKSINIVSVKLVERVGMPAVRSYWSRAGNTVPVDDVVGLTIGLGTPVTTVLDQAVSYSTFANGGVRHDPIMVTEIRDRDGFVKFKAQQHTVPDALPADVAYVITYLMQGVAQYGTGSRTSELGRPRAGKTGTSNDHRDAWFCGFTPDYTCVIWIGYRSNKSLGGSQNTGGRLAAPIWTDFMIKAHEGLPVKEFGDPPPGVVFHSIDRNTGLAGGNFREAFLKGSGPRQAPVYYDDAGDTAPVDAAGMEDAAAPEPPGPPPVAPNDPLVSVSDI